MACTGTIILENVSFVVFLDSFQCFDPNKPYFILINDEMPNTREQFRVVFLLYMSRLLCLLMNLFLFKVKLDVCVRYIFRTTYRPFASCVLSKTPLNSAYQNGDLTIFLHKE